MALPDSVPNANGRSSHVCQFFKADPLRLTRNASKFLAAGLNSGEAAIVIATPDHRAAIQRELDRFGTQPAEAVKAGRLLLLDARETMDDVFVGGYLDADRFQRAVGELVRSILAAGFKLRVYGEGAGLLWAAGQYPAAIRLEQLCGLLQEEWEFEVFCGYPIDIFGERFQSGIVDPLLCAHSHLISSVDTAPVRNALARAMNELLGANFPERYPSSSVGHSERWPKLPTGERLILWVRSHMPDHAPKILTLARRYYQEVLSSAS